MEPYVTTKWAGLLVVGESVSKEQAAEIIVRTTRWPLSSNNTQTDEIFNNLISNHKEFKKYLKNIKPLNLDLLINERITTSYISGPKGWINWDGTIFTNSYNVGKYPSIQQITNEWENIAKEFPFLNLKSQVINQEIHDEEKAIPTAQWNIKDGKVNTEFPTKLICEIHKFDEEDFLLGFFKDVGATVEDVTLGLNMAKLIKN
jgi:hypothetical protein